MTQNLSWANQVNGICKKAFGALHNLNRLKLVLPTTLKIRLAQTLIFPFLDYCDAVYADLREEQAARLQRIQNACIRFIFNLEYRDHLTHFFREANWLKLKDRRALHILTLLYKTLTIKEPSYLLHEFSFLSDFHRHNTRSTERQLISIPRHTSNYFSNSFTISAARTWNVLPPEIQHAPTVSTFKRLLKGHLLNQKL